MWLQARCPVSLGERLSALPQNRPVRLSEMTTLPALARPQRLPLLVIAALVSGLALAASAHGWRQGGLALVGVLLGASLYHASFGFASGYRRLLVHGDGRGVLAQLCLLVLLTLLFAPVLLSGAARGSVAPTGPAGRRGGHPLRGGRCSWAAAAPAARSMRSEAAAA
jgi:hypothetical protein